MAHILVVEDEPHIRFLICKVLEVAGHTTDQAADGLEALHMLYSQPKNYLHVIAWKPCHFSGSGGKALFFFDRHILAALRYTLSTG